MKRIILITALLIAQGGWAKDAKAPASTDVALKSEPSSGKVVFSAKAMGLNFDGTGEGPQGQVNIGRTITGSFKFKMDTLDTKSDMRNTHMKEKYLETAKHPYGELKLEEVSNFNPEATEGKYPFKGTLTVHGVPKPVDGNVEVRKVGTGYKVKAMFDTKISNFSIPMPAHAGLVVKDDIKVAVETQLM